MSKDDDEKRRRVTVIIAPIRVVEFEDGSLGVGFPTIRFNITPTHQTPPINLRMRFN